MLLTAHNLTKKFGDKTVLHDINLEVDRGKSLVILGGSGHGKSVLMETISGLSRPTSGTVIFDDIDISNANDRKLESIMRNVGFVFQESGLFNDYTVWENVVFRNIILEKHNKKKLLDLSIEFLQKVGISEDKAFLKPHEISGGMRKRVAIARAIVNKPKMIYFDEPQSGLDPVNADLINDVIIDCCKNNGISCITITHDIHSAIKIADKINYILNGRVIFQGNINEFLSSQNQNISQYIKASRIII